MRNVRLKDFKFRHKMGLGVGTAAALGVVTWFIGAPVNSRSVHTARAPVGVAKVPLSSTVSGPAVQLPSQGLMPLTQQRALLIKAKFAALSAPVAVNYQEIAPARPAAPVVAAIEAPQALVATAPQPMEVALQTADAPAPARPAEAQSAPVSYFGRGASSVQHLPIPSHW
jgi:hypothetical protein